MSEQHAEYVAALDRDRERIASEIFNRWRKAGPGLTLMGQAFVAIKAVEDWLAR